MTVIVRPLPAGLPRDLGAPVLPGSKSHTQRAMLLCGFLPGTRVLRGALHSQDTEVAAGALAALGARCTRDELGNLEVTATAEVPARVGEPLDLRENGTALRMLGAIIPLLGGRAVLDGAPGLRRRPLDPLVAFLRRSGARISGDSLPVEVDGTAARWPSVLTVDAALTTQVASGALLAIALRRLRGQTGPGGLIVETPTAPAYLDLTAEIARHFGCPFERRERGNDLEFSLRDAPSEPPELYTVPVDPSAATFPRVLAAMHGVVWPDEPEPTGDPHPDWGVLDDIRRLRNAVPGSEVALTELATRPDAFPALTVLAACRSGSTRLAGAPALRAKESDRIAAMGDALRAAGVRVEELGDGLVVHGPLPARPVDAGPLVPSVPADHRVVMAVALLGTVLRSGIALEPAAAVDKSWPGFWGWLGRVAEVTAR